MTLVRLLPTSASELPVITRGRGSRMWDEGGNEYLDVSSGAIVASLGHGNAEMASRLAEQARTMALAHRTQWRDPTSMRLAELIAERAPGDLDHSIFLSSGSDAIEAAMRLALRYWQLARRSTKTRFLSRHLSYHGSTLGVASLTGHPARKGVFDRLGYSFASVPEPASEDHDLCGTVCTGGCADALEQAIVRIGADSIAAFVAEPIGGSAAGVLVPGERYWARVREICDRHGIWWIADEVMTGMGRTGRCFACEHWDAVPDVLVLGKGLGGGYMPLSGAVIREPWARSLIDHDGHVEFGHTFTNTALASSAGVATIEIMKRDGLVERAGKLGVQLRERLSALDVGAAGTIAVRGRGLFWGVELRDADGRSFPAHRNVIGRMVAECRAHGLMVFRATRHRDAGDHLEGDTILFAPALTVTDDELDEMVSRLESSLRATAAAAAQASPP